MSFVWVFGYGSLASPASLSRTVTRPEVADTYRVAHLDGYVRRWNYGSMRLRGHWHHDGVDVRDGVVVSLGLETSTGSCNGMLFRITTEELELLDRRESDYARTDVSDQIRLEEGRVDDPVVTYVPRASAIRRYEQARDEGRGAVRQAYWDLVHSTFADMGPVHLHQLAGTPNPDVPIVDVVLVPRD